MTRAEADKRDFKRGLEAVGVSQREFARLLGANPATVNRWIVRERENQRLDALPVPQYARAFLLAYSELSPEQREGVRARLV